MVKWIKCWPELSKKASSNSSNAIIFPFGLCKGMNILSYGLNSYTAVLLEG